MTRPKSASDLRREGLDYVKASDEHGAVQVADGMGGNLSTGDRLWLIPGHCDPTVNLHDWIVAVRAGVVEAVWPVTAPRCRPLGFRLPTPPPGSWDGGPARSRPVGDVPIADAGFRDRKLTEVRRERNCRIVQ